ncbi:uncharacterized protein KD926_010727 [Aspergillus affinis]|uniref:uncharacterized protein n=1 Tax=Aspergillus affinis TaxID=1070780 RepID=UPI0022FE0368|nr:uncharacterized protein KD926_010727 [Aspergillus affinis]KAI9038515.1 hypothetical protein KD926_010727 [Aspergillus affinis]
MSVNCVIDVAYLSFMVLVVIPGTYKDGACINASTVGIAAAGLALGRVDRDPPKLGRFRKKPSPLHNQCAHTIDSPESPLSNNVRPISLQPAVATEDPSENPKSSPGKSNGVPNEDHPRPITSRRKSSLAGILLRRRGQTLSNPPLRIAEDSSPVSHSRQPSSSWMRRLSFQPENRSSCQSPHSPSINGPASPGFGPSGQRRAPNKLVKRPPSQHSAANPLFSHPPSPTTSTLHRPATSYQRRETGGHKATQSLCFEPGLAPDSSSQAPVGLSTDNGVWRPYLNADPSMLPDRPIRRFSTTTKPRDQGLRRIIPRVDTLPALLLATSLSNKEPKQSIHPEESVPSSPVEFRNPFGPTQTISPEPKPHSSAETKGRQLSLTGETDPKAPVPSPQLADGSALDNDSIAHPKRRAISSPLPNLSKLEGAPFHAQRSRERRNITDPTVFNRSHHSPRVEAFLPLTSGVMAPRNKTISRSRANTGHSQDFGQYPLPSDTVALSSLYGSERLRSKRHSIAASDPASTVIGSDDTRIFTSGDEDDTDFLSDTAFDSIRTHLTANSTTGLQAPRIEAIFDQGIPSYCRNPESSKPGHPHQTNSRNPQAMINGPHGHGEDTGSIRFSGPCAREADGLEDGDSKISFPSDLTDDEDALSLVGALPGEAGEQVLQPCDSPKRPTFPPRIAGSNARDLTHESLDCYPKVNIFDWSEQPKNDREAPGSDGRPRTVHGKHGPEARGSRPHGRKAPNTLHLRSQSVPVSREPPTSNESRQTSGKFGTWGLGSKGVSEDWDSDFEFEDGNDSTAGESIKPNRNPDVPQRGMLVPQAIMDRQASLHGQFGQVQELTLLVEELKRLRHQASFLGIVRGPSSELWKEAEGIVDLATLDDEDANHSPPGSPSSLTFSFDDSEGESSTNDTFKRASGESWQPSFSEHSNSMHSHAADDKEISAKANSVLDLIYRQRVSPDPTLTETQLPKSKKLPFDTQSLRDLVIRAGVVTRALKEVIRKAEGVALDPSEIIHAPNPPFSRIFKKPSSEHLSNFKTRCAA